MILQPSMSDLNDPAFLRHVREQFPEEVRPDRQDYGLDFDHAGGTLTDAEAGDRYRQAQARKLMRMWRAWKTGTN